MAIKSMFKGWEVHVGFINLHLAFVTIVSPDGEVECKRVTPSANGRLPTGAEIRRREFFLIQQKLNKASALSSKG